MSATVRDPIAAPAGGRPVRSGVALRAVALVALAVFGALHWGAMVAPAQPWRLVGGVALAGVVAAAAIVLRGAPRVVRVGGATAVALAAAAAVLLLAGVPTRFLRAAAWDELAAGVAQGLGTLPTVGIPYDGSDPWVRLVLLAGGIVLPTLAAVAAVRLRRDGRDASPVPALVLLGALYAVPAIQFERDGARLAGLAFAALLCACLWVDRIPRAQARAAGALVVAGLLAGLALAPSVDAERPLVDPEGIARSLGAGGGQSFVWDHRYGPLNWPRDGREVLRIRARERQYWKAVNVTSFDGRAWRVPPPRRTARLQTTIDPGRPDWRERLEVTVRELRSPYFVGAGSTLRIEDSSARTPVPSGPGTFRTLDGPLGDGQTYAAEVYVPDPPRRELDDRPQPYPAFVDDALTMRLPAAAGEAGLPAPRRGPPEPSRTTVISFPDWNEQERGLDPRDGGAVGGARRALEGSAYARTYALAQRMREAADTPDELARDLVAMFQEDFAYSERPPERAVPLDAFLFDDRAGYCQQFSGAMALLLRMAGVPARVASGFSPGTRDEVRGEWVVRDYDAHSWVEAYVPGAGWVIYDPTPAASPAGGRDVSVDLDAPGAQPAADEEPDVQSTPRQPAPPAVADDPGPREGGDLSSLALAGGAAVALALLAAALWALRRRGASPTDGDALVGELRRALHRAGRPAPPQATLAALEATLPPDARDYVRAIAARRYGFTSGGPTPAQRGALRRALAGGRSPRARLRGWWALPPARRAAPRG